MKFCIVRNLFIAHYARLSIGSEFCLASLSAEFRVRHRSLTSLMVVVQSCPVNRHTVRA